jgi:hypothetical protein
MLIAGGRRRWTQYGRPDSYRIRSYSQQFLLCDTVSMGRVSRPMHDSASHLMVEAKRNATLRLVVKENLVCYKFGGTQKKHQALRALQWK